MGRGGGPDVEQAPGEQQENGSADTGGGLVHLRTGTRSGEKCRLCTSLSTRSITASDWSSSAWEMVSGGSMRMVLALNIVPATSTPLSNRSLATSKPISSDGNSMPIMR